MQVRLHTLSTYGRAKTKTIGEHGASAHKLAIDPSNTHCFYSCGEDGAIRHYDIRQKRAGSMHLMSVYSKERARVRPTPSLPLSCFACVTFWLHSCMLRLQVLCARCSYELAFVR